SAGSAVSVSVISPPVRRPFRLFSTLARAMGWAPSGQHGIRLRADTDARSGAALYGEVVRATRRWGPWAIAAAWTVTAVAVTAAATIAPARTFGDPAVITAVLVGVVPLALSVVLARR